MFDNPRDDRCRYYGALMLLVSLTIATGGWSVFEFTDSKTDSVRDEEVAEFNNVTEKWNHAYRSLWTQVGSIHLSGLCPPMTCKDGSDNAELLPVASGDKVLDTHSDVSHFVPLHYEVEAQVTFPNGFEELSTELTLTLNGTGDVLVVPNVVLSKRKSVSTSNWKVCSHRHRGALDTVVNACVSYYAVSHICVAATYENETEWKLAAEGCGDPKYAPLHVPRRQRRNVVDGVQTTFPVKVIMRCADADPYLAAYRITHGSLTFGQSRWDRIGIACFLAGLSLFFFSMLLAVLWARSRCAGGQASPRYSHVDTFSTVVVPSYPRKTEGRVRAGKKPHQEDETPGEEPERQVVAVVGRTAKTVRFESSTGAAVVEEREMSEKYSPSTATDV